MSIGFSGRKLKKKKYEFEGIAKSRQKVFGKKVTRNFKFYPRAYFSNVFRARPRTFYREHFVVQCSQIVNYKGP